MLTGKASQIEALFFFYKTKYALKQDCSGLFSNMQLANLRPVI